MQVHIFFNGLFAVLCFGAIIWLDNTYFQFFQQSPIAQWLTRGIFTLIFGGIIHRFIFFPLYKKWFSTFLDSSFSPFRYKIETFIVQFYMGLACFLVGAGLLNWFAPQILSQPIGLVILFAIGLVSVWVVRAEAGLLHFYTSKTKFFREARRRGDYGVGGSGRYQTMLENFEWPWTPGKLFLGESLYSVSGSQYFGIDDDRHAVLIGGTGGGKGTGVIIPNLLLWPENVICVDPKKSNLYVTGKNPLRGKVFVIDIRNFVQGFDNEKIRWNPLADVDTSRSSCVKEITTITKAILISTSKQEKYWDENTEQFITGLIAHVLTMPKYEGRRNLVTVYKECNLFGKEADALLLDMQNNEACYELPSSGASALQKMKGTNTAAIIEGTISTHFKWLRDPDAQRFLEGGDGFSIWDITHKRLSIYLCSQATDLKEHNRIVRLFFIMALHAMENPRKAKTRKCLFLMDEFASLGYMDMLEDSAAYSRSLGVKMFPVVQSIKQLEKIYGVNWETFLESAAFFAFMSIDGRENLNYISKAIGNRRVMVEGTSVRETTGSRGNQVASTASYEMRPLMEPRELVLELDRNKGRYLVFPAGNDPVWVNRCDYFKHFDPSMYGKDLEYTGPTTTARNGWTLKKYWGQGSSILKPVTKFPSMEQLFRDVSDYKIIIEARKHKHRPVPSIAPPEVLPPVSLAAPVPEPLKKIEVPVRKMVAPHAPVQEINHDHEQEESRIKQKEQELLRSLQQQKDEAEKRIKEEARKHILKLQTLREQEKALKDKEAELEQLKRKMP